MRGILFTAATIASLLLGGPAARHAEAATLAPASILGNSGMPPIQYITNICGANGCVRVQTQRIQHHKPGSVAAKHI
jgi:hypothetical protein